LSRDGCSFSSDNVAPAAPEVIAALVAANEGAALSYGEDEHTRQLTLLARELFETDLAIFPVTTGTAANALALAALALSYGAVYCHEAAHVAVDEAGAPEFFTGGAKLVGLPSADGKLTPAQLAAPLAQAAAAGVHHVRPAAVSVTQATEWGTVYRPEEVAALAAVAKAHGLRLHMDGARFANAVARLGCSPAEATWKAGVDVLSFGATKNGALAAEVEDALPQRAAHGAAGGRPVAAPRRAREPDGRALGRRAPAGAGRPPAAAGRGERDLRGAAGPRRRRPQPSRVRMPGLAGAGRRPRPGGPAGDELRHDAVRGRRLAGSRRGGYRRAPAGRAKRSSMNRP
jgi:hypothetical protein